jgi:hypothetical protein
MFITCMYLKPFLHRPSLIQLIIKASIIAVESEYLELRVVMAQLMFQVLMDEDQGDSEAVHLTDVDDHHSTSYGIVRE